MHVKRKFICLIVGAQIQYILLITRLSTSILQAVLSKLVFVVYLCCLMFQTYGGKEIFIFRLYNQAKLIMLNCQCRLPMICFTISVIQQQHNWPNASRGKLAKLVTSVFPQRQQIVREKVKPGGNIIW